MTWLDAVEFKKGSHEKALEEVSKILGVESTKLKQEARELRPADLGLTSYKITYSANASTYTVNRRVSASSVVAIYGIYALDTRTAYVEVYKGTVKDRVYPVKAVYYFRNKNGVLPVPIVWRPDETLKLIFYADSTSTAAQDSEVFFEGIVAVPPNQEAATVSVA